MRLAREAGQDIRHTLRLWAVRPWPTAFGIAALAIGIGAGTGVFSVVNALLVRSLPFREPERLAGFRNFQPPHDSARQFHDWRHRSAYLADAALFEQNDVNLGAETQALRAHVAQTSWNFFETLGARPAVGRTFADGEDTPGHNAVAVIGYGLWQQVYGGDPRVPGSTIRVDGSPLTILGVAPPGFDYPNGTVLWKAALFTEGNNGWDTVARLKPGVGWPRARAAFQAEAEHLADVPSRSQWRPEMRSLRDSLAGPVKNGSLLLFAGVTLVLLIACTNVANLLMARTADRAAELSVRSALGASRGRLVRQLLTECLMLSGAAAVAGMALALWTARMAAKVSPPSLAAQAYSILDGRVLAFAVALATISGLLFGVLPSLYVGRIHTFGTRSSAQPRGSRRLREGLAGAQVALTIVLLTASISVGRAFVHLMGMDRGFDTRGVVTVGVSLKGTTHDSAERRLAWFEEAVDRVRRLPGVRSASATEFLPLYAVGFVGGPFGVDGYHPPGHNSTRIPVLSDYFRTMGGKIVRGREFTDAEVRSGARVAVVNERFAAEYGGASAVMGRQLTAGSRGAWKIIGVVGQINFATEADPTMGDTREVFLPSSTPGGFFSTIVARVDGRAESHLAEVRDAVRSVDPQVPVFGVKTMQQRLDEAVARPRFYRTAVWMFAVFALLLAVIGIYAVVSYAVVQRTREMGVRMALGTTPARLRGLLLRQGLMTVAIGALGGVAGATVTGRFLRGLVEGATPVDAMTATASVLCIVLVAAVSIWTATRRIAGFDIAAILRSE